MKNENRTESIVPIFIKAGWKIKFEMFEKKTCPGCHGEINKNSDECVRFKIMIMVGYIKKGIQHIKTEEKMIVYLHRKCLADNIWMIERYVNGTNDFSHVEIEMKIDGTKIKYQMFIGNQGWSFKKHLPDGKHLKFNKNLAVFFDFVLGSKDMAFIAFGRNELYAPLILSSKNDPIINSHTSTPEYVESFDNAKNKFDMEHREDMVVKADEELMLDTYIRFAFNSAIKIQT